MSETVEIARHAPYIVAAYGVSAFVLAALIVARWRKLKKALKDERARNEAK